ncbi:MAG: hypothetical protein KGL39_58615 [Patescibacteria group bacterium]|nr:hypothetical protein [Patescibacteria group bacterium]
MGAYSSIAVKDLASQGIRPKATCRTCGRSRVIHGGLLERTFAPEDRLHDYQLHQFAKRLVCGNCKTRWPMLELGVWE